MGKIFEVIANVTAPWYVLQSSRRTELAPVSQLDCLTTVGAGQQRLGVQSLSGAIIVLALMLMLVLVLVLALVLLIMLYR